MLAKPGPLVPTRSPSPSDFLLHLLQALALPAGMKDRRQGLMRANRIAVVMSVSMSEHVHALDRRHMCVDMRA